MKIETTPEHLAFLQGVKQLMINHSAKIPVVELQAVLSQCIGYLVPLGDRSVEEIDELVSENIAIGIVAGYQAIGDES